MNTEDESSPLENGRDAVMADYQGAPTFRTNPRAQEYLHLFFSPSRVPVGLTNSEVAICIRLYPYRARMIKRYNHEEDAKLALENQEPIPFPTFTDALELVGAGVADTIEEATERLERLWEMAEHLRCHPIRTLSLPRELQPFTVMTRERFRQGIRQFIAEYRKRCGV